MREPPRLLDESNSELTRALLRAGRSYPVSPQLRGKTLTALGVGAAAALSAGVAGSASLAPLPEVAASASVVGKATWLKTLAVLVALGAVPGAYFAWNGAREPEAPASRGVSKPPRDKASLPPPAVPLEPAPPAIEGQSSLARPVKANKAVKPALTRETLGLELEALDAARKALAVGDAQGALSLLDAYERANPRGRLRLEAEVLRIDALAKSGRSGLARKRAEAFLVRHPNSVLGSKVRSYISQ